MKYSIVIYQRDFFKMMKSWGNDKEDIRDMDIFYSILLETEIEDFEVDIDISDILGRCIVIHSNSIYELSLLSEILGLPRNTISIDEIPLLHPSVINRDIRKILRSYEVIPFEVIDLLKSEEIVNILLAEQLLKGYEHN